MQDSTEEKDNLIAFVMPDDKDKEDDLIDFKVSTKHHIKVIGVGGGGDNAVGRMYQSGIHDVTFVACNTDKQALDASPVSNKLRIGSIGAGGVPEKARKLAEEHLDAIKKELAKDFVKDEGNLVFVTAGMGGGTGTGAGPIIAREAKKMDILTVGVVTLPFVFEGRFRIDQALDGLEEMAKNVDSLLVVNNERLFDIYPKLPLTEAFSYADNTLTSAVRSIADIINIYGEIANVDFNDVNRVLKDGGLSIISTGTGKGESRVMKAIEDAINSPLLNNIDIYNAKNILFVFYCSDNKENSIRMEEFEEVSEFMEKFHREYIYKWGAATLPDLDDEVKVTILASGFENPADDTTESTTDERAIEARDTLREKYYGKKANKKSPPKQIFHFSDDDFDNEEIISMVASAPTLTRTATALRRMNDKRKHRVGGEKAPQAKVAQQPQNEKIEF